MISKEEILKNHTCPPELESNLADLLLKINKLAVAWGNPMIVTSGFRDKEDQVRIYNAKGITDEAKMHMGSKHFTCQAVDIFDPDHRLQLWIRGNLELMKEIGLWMEDFSETPSWVHLQIAPPLSGNRFFMP